MRPKYKKFLKAAYIDYGDDYCGSVSGAFTKPAASENDVGNILCSKFNTVTVNELYSCNTGVAIDTSGLISFYTPDYNTTADINNFKAAYSDIRIIYEYRNPIPELVDAPQIQEANSYSMIISQGGKTVEWSSFETE